MRQAKGSDQPQQRNGLSETQGRVEDVHPRMDGILQVRLREEFVLKIGNRRMPNGTYGGVRGRMGN